MWRSDYPQIQTNCRFRLIRAHRFTFFSLFPLCSDEFKPFKFAFQPHSDSSLSRFFSILTMRADLIFEKSPVALFIYARLLRNFHCLFIITPFIDVSLASNCVNAGVPINNLHNFFKTPGKSSLGGQTNYYWPL